jgi:hypothetical protein
MAGPHDQVAEQARGPDTVRLREPDRVDAELQERMERLPPGHPSSPYDGDGSPKPPVPDPFEHDLPIPGDPDYQPDALATPEADRPTDDLSEGVDHPQHEVDECAARGELPADSETDRSLAGEDTPREGPDGSWEWKACRLTPEQRRAADEAFGRCTAAEGRDPDGNYGEYGLTPSMRRIESELDRGQLVDKTEEYALKTPDRFKEKLSKAIAKNPDKTAEELSHEIHDAVRYTFILGVEEYSEAYWSAQEKLEEKGYELEVRRNMWTNREYKGINSRWRDPESKLPFEIQFHTQASWEAKQETHRAYEKITNPRTRPDERELLRTYQKEVSARVQMPERVAEIPDYRKEGR